MMDEGKRPSPMEAECKFRVSDRNAVVIRLAELNARLVGEEQHCDTYFRHPSRDFRSTDEALRLREVDGQPFITYKGPRIEGPIKIRPEIEIPLVAESQSQWMDIWKHLGFEIVAQVRKSRSSYQVYWQERSLTVTLDQVERLGCFAEVERVLMDSDEIPQAERDIMQFAGSCGLTQVERSSYLGLLLELL